MNAAGGPVIPSFGTADRCITENHLFCTSWVRQHWGDTLQPALLQHIKLTILAVAIGFVFSFAAALVAHRYHRTSAPFGLIAALLYTVPSLALFQLLVPFTGLTEVTVEIALVSYTFIILFRNIVAGLDSAPPEVIEAARGMGLSRRQTLWRVELPLALPAIIAGLRIAIVSTISIATIAAFLIPEGLGLPIFRALQTYFKTEFVAAALLAVGLALLADLSLVALQRSLVRWRPT